MTETREMGATIASSDFFNLLMFPDDGDDARRDGTIIASSGF